MAIARNIAAQFQTTIPNVQPGVTVIVPPAYDGIRIGTTAQGTNRLAGVFAAGLSDGTLAEIGRQEQERARLVGLIELRRFIARRCAGHIRRQGRVRR